MRSLNISSRFSVPCLVLNFLISEMLTDILCEINQEIITRVTLKNVALEIESRGKLSVVY
jgi:hypothetical protein